MFDKKIDERPGSVPDIRADGDSVIYLIDIPGQAVRLIIRSNPDGSIYASATVKERLR